MAGGEILAKLFGIGKGVSDVADSVGNATEKIIVAAKGDLTAEDKGAIAKLKIQVGLEFEKVLQDGVQAARDFAVRYEGSADQVPKWLLLIRSLIRPVVTIYMFVIFGAVSAIDIINIAKRTPDYTLLLKDLPSEFWWMFGIVLTFWFGGKVVERTVNTIRSTQGGTEEPA